jgi:hypothetical protein
LNIQTVCRTEFQTQHFIERDVEKLSEAVHGAKEDAELFAAAKEKIEEHFEFRRLYKLDPDIVPDKKPDEPRPNESQSVKA